MSSSDLSDYLFEKQITFKEKEAELLRILHRLRQLGIAHNVTIDPEKMQWPKARNPMELVTADLQEEPQPTSSDGTNSVFTHPACKNEPTVTLEPNIDDYPLSESTRQLILMSEMGIDISKVMMPSPRRPPAVVRSLHTPKPSVFVAPCADQQAAPVGQRYGKVTPDVCKKKNVYNVDSSPQLSQNYTLDGYWKVTPTTSRIPERSKIGSNLKMLHRNQIATNSSPAVQRMNLTKAANFTAGSSQIGKQSTEKGATSASSTFDSVAQEDSPCEPQLSTLGSVMIRKENVTMESPESPELSEISKAMLRAKMV